MSQELETKAKVRRESAPEKVKSGRRVKYLVEKDRKKKKKKKKKKKYLPLPTYLDISRFSLFNTTTG